MVSLAIIPQKLERSTIPSRVLYGRSSTLRSHPKMRLWEHSLSARSAQGDVDPHSWLHRRLSSIFSGESNILSASGRSFRLQKSNGISLHESSTSNRVPQAGLRSPTSTRSIIDPSASPFTSAGSISPDAFRPLQMHTNPPSVAYDRPRTTSSGARAERHLSRALAGSHRHSTRRGLRPQRRKWVWMPHIRNAKHRSNAIGALVSGVILMVMLSICERDLFASKEFVADISE